MAENDDDTSFEEYGEGEGKPFNESLEGLSNPSSARDLETVYDVSVVVSAQLGKSTLPLYKLLQMRQGAILELDKKVGEAVEIFVNNRLVARGEVVIVNNNLGISMTEIVKVDISE